MAVSMKMIAANFQSRVDSLAKDAREVTQKATALGNGVQNVEELKMAASIISEACQKASKYLDKAYRGR